MIFFIHIDTKFLINNNHNEIGRKKKKKAKIYFRTDLSKKLDKNASQNAPISFGYHVKCEISRWAFQTKRKIFHVRGKNFNRSSCF